MNTCVNHAANAFEINTITAIIPTSATNWLASSTPKKSRIRTKIGVCSITLKSLARAINGPIIPIPSASIKDVTIKIAPATKRLNLLAGKT